MQFKGTKGKWAVDYEESRHNEFGQLATPISRIDAHYHIIVGLCEVYGDDEISKANSKLIAHAPEMLEMLKKAERTLREIYGCDTSEILNLIKSATKID